MKFEDNSEQFISDMREAVNDGLSAAAVELQSAMKTNFGSSGSGYVKAVQTKKRRRDKDGKYVKSKKTGKVLHSNTRKNIYASAPPGEFPGIRTGTLRNSIYATKAQDLVAYAGTNLAYGSWLETGWVGKARDGSTYAVPARPWAQRSFAMASGKMAEAAISKAKASMSAKGWGNA